MKAGPAAIQVTLTFDVVRAGAPFDREGFHAFGEHVMESLLALERCNNDITDADVSTDASTSTVAVGVLVATGDHPTAYRRAFDVIRTALHAAGAATPSWPAPDDTLTPQTVTMARTVLA
ncbi:MAG TPA: hypothetical protein VFX70_03885 [Mycobacteriales bacterium]|nr:hypothetical protein [Mycobacteriales bacterium]